jgi:hypothetical protein
MKLLEEKWNDNCDTEKIPKTLLSVCEFEFENNDEITKNIEKNEKNVEKNEVNVDDNNDKVFEFYRFYKDKFGKKVMQYYKDLKSIENDLKLSVS